MLAVDTNVVVRYIVADDAAQAAKARAAIDGGAVFIPVSVLLETEWVLRSLYKLSMAEIAAAIRTLAGQPTVSLDQPLLVRVALEWAEAGVDLADALHIAASRHCQAFLSFDADLAKSAKRAGLLEVRRP